MLIFTACLAIAQERTFSEMIYKEGLVLNADSTPFSGTLLEKWSNGRNRFVAKVQQGKLEGTAKEFYENGQLRRIQAYESGVLCCSMKEFFSNGELKMQAEIGEQAFCGGNKVGNLLYGYYNEEQKLIYKVKARARLVFMTDDLLSPFFSHHLPFHRQAAYRIFDNKRLDYGMFIDDSRKISCPVCED